MAANEESQHWADEPTHRGPYPNDPYGPRYYHPYEQAPYPTPQPQQGPHAGYGAPRMDPRGQHQGGYPWGFVQPHPAGSMYPPGTTLDPITGEPLSDKDRTAAGLLQIFLGGLGVGRFYIGDTRTGATQLGLMLFGFFTVFFIIGIFIIFGVGLWAFIDGIMMLTGNVRDPYGRKLR